MGGTREEAKCAEGTRRLPLHVRRGTRAGGKILQKVLQLLREMKVSIQDVFIWEFGLYIWL